MRIIGFSITIKVFRATIAESVNIYFRKLNSSEPKTRSEGKYILPKPKWGLCHMQSRKAAFSWRRCLLGKNGNSSARYIIA